MLLKVSVEPWSTVLRGLLMTVDDDDTVPDLIVNARNSAERCIKVRLPYKQQKGSTIKIQTNKCTQWGSENTTSSYIAFSCKRRQCCYYSCPLLSTAALRCSINEGWRDLHCCDFHGSSAFTRRHQRGVGKVRKIQGEKCVFKVMSRISTHNTRLMSRALHPPERCGCCWI